MALPNFLIIGAMKSGTDSLWEYLRAHPQVFMSHTKELDFFVEDLNWSRGRWWYEAQFAEAVGAFALGEASTSYTKFPYHSGVPARIAGLIPNIRLIYLLRNPIERMRSQYLHLLLHRQERRPIDVALLDAAYFNLSRYSLQIEQYLEHFPRDQLLLVTSEELRDQRSATLEVIFGFLGVETRWWGHALNGEYHRTAEKRVMRKSFEILQRLPGYRQMAAVAPGAIKSWTIGVRTRGIDSKAASISDGLRQELGDRLAPDIARLRKLMSPDFDGWGIA